MHFPRKSIVRVKVSNVTPGLIILYHSIKLIIFDCKTFFDIIRCTHYIDIHCMSRRVIGQRLGIDFGIHMSSTI